MKKQTNLLLLFAVVISSVFTLSSCNSSSKNRNKAPKVWIETFDTPNLVVAGPTSYGENLYEGYKEEDPRYPRFKSYKGTEDTSLDYGIAPDTEGVYNLWNGGTVVSNWCIYGENPEGKGDDWWYSFNNQCSVYNSKVESGARLQVGHSGDHFAVINGVAEISANNDREFTFQSLWVANAAYTYGVMTNGNSFSASLVNTNGYLKLIIKAYAIEGKGPVATDEIYLADFRKGKDEILKEWTQFELTNIKKQRAHKLVFEFEGSDMGEWGLNTPSYACIDDIAYVTHLEEEEDNDK